MNPVLSVLAALGGAALFLLKLLLVLLGAALVLVLIALLIPFCADLSWEGPPEGEEGAGVFRVRAGALGLTFPVFQHPKPPPPPAAPAKRPGPLGRLLAKLKARLAAWRQARKEKKAAARPKPETPAKPKEKAKITLHIICTMLEGAGRLTRAVFGALRLTHIRIFLPVGGGEPDAAAAAYGKASAALYPALGVLDHFLYLDFDELRLVPCIDPDEPKPQAHVSLRVSARAFFIAAAAVRVIFAFYREKVLDVFL